MKTDIDQRIEVRVSGAREVLLPTAMITNFLLIEPRRRYQERITDHDDERALVPIIALGVVASVGRACLYNEAIRLD